MKDWWRKVNRDDNTTGQEKSSMESSRLVYRTQIDCE